MRFGEEIGIIADALIYNQHYAPDYPSEDETDLKSEFTRLVSDLRSLPSGSSDRDLWIELAVKDIESAFALYSAERIDEGWKALDSALGYLQNAKKGKKRSGAAFVVAPDGTVEAPRSES